jgi:outer membrane lipoprotein-sorting protein
MINKLLILLGFIIFENSNLYAQTAISATLNTRTIRAGKVVVMNGEIYYKIAGGKMISHYTEPFEQYIFNTAKGELKIYDPKKNTITQQVNFQFGTETTQLYYFFNKYKEDMGLRKMGFINKNSRYDNNLLVTTWQAPPKVEKDIKQVELVHKDGNPIYSKYIDGQNKVVKKIYYSDYQRIGNSDFPLSVTQIDYITAKDSAIVKTKYSDFKINENVNAKLANYNIPSNAKYVK